MANKHWLKWSVVKKQAAARKLSKGKKAAARVFIGNENPLSRKNTSFKSRRRYYENKQNFPKKTLPTKDISSLVEMWIIDDRWFFLKWKKKNFITRSMVDSKWLDFYGMPRAK